jgi:hypothetical protein
MDKKLEQKLVKAFPKLYRDYGGDMAKTCMAWGFECGDGWFDLIWKLSGHLKWSSPTARALQVKEKFGALRFYVTDLKDDHCESEAAIAEAEAISIKTCEDCGKPGKMRETRKWYYVACNACAKKHERRLLKN